MIYSHTPPVNYLRPSEYAIFPIPVLRDIVLGELRRTKELVQELGLNTAFDIIKIN